MQVLRCVESCPAKVPCAWSSTRNSLRYRRGVITPPTWCTISINKGSPLNCAGPRCSRQELGAGQAMMRYDFIEFLTNICNCFHLIRHIDHESDVFKLLHSFI